MSKLIYVESAVNAEWAGIFDIDTELPDDVQETQLKYRLKSLFLDHAEAIDKNPVLFTSNFERNTSHMFNSFDINTAILEYQINRKDLKSKLSTDLEKLEKEFIGSIYELCGGKIILPLEVGILDGNSVVYAQTCVKLHDDAIHSFDGLGKYIFDATDEKYYIMYADLDSQVVINPATFKKYMHRTTVLPQRIETAKNICRRYRAMGLEM